MKHERTHKPFSCSKCYKNSQLLLALKTHKRTQNGDNHTKKRTKVCLSPVKHAREASVIDSHTNNIPAHKQKEQKKDILCCPRKKNLNNLRKKILWKTASCSISLRSLLIIARSYTVRHSFDLLSYSCFMSNNASACWHHYKHSF